MSRRMTISRWPSSKPMVNSSLGSASRPRKSSAYISPTRLGVSLSPSLWGSSPMARISSRIAFSTLLSSTACSSPVFLPDRLAVNKEQALRGGSNIVLRPQIQCRPYPLQVWKLLISKASLLLVDGHYPPYKPLVVARGVAGFHLAFVGQVGVLEEGDRGPGRLFPGNIKGLELVHLRPLCGPHLGDELGLLHGDKADPELPALQDKLIGEALERDAHPEEGRVHGEGAIPGRGHGVLLFPGAGGNDDGYAGIVLVELADIKAGLLTHASLLFPAQGFFHKVQARGEMGECGRKGKGRVGVLEAVAGD